MKKFLSAIFVLSALYAAAQPQIEFEKLTHDFGTIREDLKKTSFDFIFKNTGDKPLVIKNVKTVCGCTAPEWTKEPVMPGNTGKVSVVFHPEGRPFPFSKGITVSTNAGDDIKLTITGIVERKLEDYTAIYGDSIGKMRIRNLKPSVIPVTTEDNKTSSPVVYEIANPSETQPINVSISAPDYFTIDVPKVLRPREQYKIRFYLNGAKRNKGYKYIDDNIVIAADDAKAEIRIGTTVKRSFAHMTGPDLDRAPRVSINKTVLDLGNIKSKKQTATVKIQNAGRSDLILYGYSSDNPAMRCSIKDGMSIKPGKSVDIKIEISDFEGNRLNANLYIDTNDPRNSMPVITMKGLMN